MAEKTTENGENERRRRGRKERRKKRKKERVKKSCCEELTCSLAALLSALLCSSAASAPQQLHDITTQRSDWMAEMLRWDWSRVRRRMCGFIFITKGNLFIKNWKQRNKVLDAANRIRIQNQRFGHDDDYHNFKWIGSSSVQNQHLI